MLSLPFTGRQRELRALLDVGDEVASARGRLVLLSGDGGVGKSRLLESLAATVTGKGWQVATGQAFPLETAMAYATFADALGPLLARLDGGALMRLTRGDRALLAALAPQLLPADAERVAARLGDTQTPAEQRVRLHTAVLQLLGKLADRAPLLLCIENMHWADSASVELLHFLGRQASRYKLLLVASWNETDQPLSAELRLAIRSLRSLGALDLQLAPHSAEEVCAMITTHFGVEAEVAMPFAARLHQATQGNAFFVEQTLRELVTRGDLRQQGNVWVGWHLESPVLPASVREVLRARLERLSPAARRLAELVAVAGTSATHDVVRHVWHEDESHQDHFGGALQELRDAALLSERDAGVTVAYTLAHPLMQQALVESVGRARERDLHATFALAVEAAAGAGAGALAEEIAAHWLRADPRVHVDRAVAWLIAAGRASLQRVARREASILLRAALDRCDASPGLVPPATITALVDELARVYRRLAEYHEAIAMSERARDRAHRDGSRPGVATAERRIGLSLQGLGRREEALAHFDVAIAISQTEADDTLRARTLLAKADCLQAIGLVQEAKHEVHAALSIAERVESLPLLARAHRMLLTLHLWTGPAHKAWAHSRHAVALAERTGERNLAWSAHFASAVLGGLTSNTTALAAHLAEARRLAQELSSPLLELRTTEIALEYRAGIGEWDRALADGERALVLARALDQTTLLARIAHWVSGVYMQRGDFVTAQRLVQEAWDVSGAGHVDHTRPFEVHGVLPAFVARTRYLHAIGEHDAALEQGRTALAMADRTRYIAWAVYRLLPTMASAALAAQDETTLRAVRTRLAAESEKLAHPIGQAWVRVIDGAFAERAGDYDRATDDLQRAIAALDAVPYPYDAADVRVRLSRLMVARGARDEAIQEARAALTLFQSLGAKPAEASTQELLRELGAKLPPSSRSSLGALTARELEIVKLVAQRLSNKDIGARLGITARTVGTHLANIYDKLAVRDRTALGDLVREQGLHR